MKAEVNSRPETGQIWATGSQKFALMKGISESLAGRLIPLEFMPLSIYDAYWSWSGTNTVSAESGTRVKTSHSGHKRSLAFHLFVAPFIKKRQIYRTPFDISSI